MSDARHSNQQFALLTISIIIATGLLWFFAVIHSTAFLAATIVTAIPAAYLIVRFKAERLLLQVIAFSLPFSIEAPFVSESMLRLPTEPLIAMASMVLVIHFLRDNREVKNTIRYEALWLAPLFLMFVITSVLGNMPMVSFKFSLVNMAYALTFYLLILYESKGYPGLFPRLLMIYSAGFLIVMLWSLYQFHGFDWNPIVVPGIFEPFYKDHTIFGASAALLTAFWFAMAFTQKQKSAKMFMWLLSAVFFAAVVYSTSRGAFLSLVVFFLIWAFYRLKPRIRYVVPVFLLAAVILMMNRPAIDHLISGSQTLSYEREAGLIERTASVANVSTDVSNLERLNRWHAAWMMFRDKPLTGFGPGTYQFEYIPYQSPALMNRLSVTNPYDIPEGSGGTAHSEYLLALSEMGIFGLAAWLLLFGRWIVLSIRRWHTHPRQMYMSVAVAALSTYFFHALVNNFLTTDKFAFLFWGAAAWLVANYKTDETPMSKIPTIREQDF
ncbi:MAG: O-antigen ligase domain-containing protein [Bacteroidia bacterium]|nr:MAG: O-antigen ligase domain-containing protein [Bacteroidia bacterium]